MIKKKIANWLSNPQEEKEKQEKIRLVEQAIVNSRLNKKYRELGEIVYRTFLRKKTLNDKSVKFKKLVKEVKELLIEKKKIK